MGGNLSVFALIMEFVAGNPFIVSLTLPLFLVFVCFLRAICAKHVNDKAAKWAKSKRPRKSRPSDINRAPIIYDIHSFHKPAEYDISSEPAAPAAKPAATEN